MVDSLEALSLTDEWPKLPNGWGYQPLSDLVKEQGICYGIVQPGSHSAKGIPVIRVNNIRNGRIDPTDILSVESTIEEKYQRSRLRGGEVLITLVGTLGEVAIVPPELRGWNVARAVGVIPVRNDPGSRWVSICLRSPFIQHCIKMWATTTVQATFNLRDVAKLPIPIPPQGIREAIEHILGTLDDKIELNREMNTTLEAMAKALFQSWFVDFDPVRAKLNGQQPAGMDAETAALFPDHFQDSPLGPIPHQWTVGIIEDATSLIIDYRGRTPKKMGSDWSESGIPAVSAKNVKGGRLIRPEMFNFVSEDLYQKWMKDKLAIGDILMTSEAPLGELFYLALDAHYCLSQRVFALRVNPLRCESTFLYYWLESPSCQAEIVNRGTGTTVEGIRQSELRKVPVLLPPLPIQKAAAKYLASWTEKVHQNEKQSRTLATLRDTLLPKLLSGELEAHPA